MHNVTRLQDYANPRTAPYLHFYPDESDGVKSEVWHFARWQSLPRDLLTPMYFNGRQQFYVNELVQLVDRRLVIPLIWVYKSVMRANVKERILCCEAYSVSVVQVRKFLMCTMPLK